MGKNFWNEFPAMAGSEEGNFLELIMTEQHAGSLERFHERQQKWLEVRAQPGESWVTIQVMDVSDRMESELELGQRSERMQLLSETLSQLLNAADPETIVRELFPKVADILGVDTFFYYVVEDQSDVLRLHSSAGLTEEIASEVSSLKFGTAMCGRVALHRKAVVLKEISTSADPALDFLRNLGMQCFACNPLMVGDRLLGTLAFASRSRPAFDEDELEFLRVITRSTAIALDRLHQANQLRASERLYRAVGESINYGIWICEKDGRNQYASESFLNLVGMTQDECSEFGWSRVLHPEDGATTVAEWQEVSRNGNFWEKEHRFKGVDGNWHPVLARGVPVRNEIGEVLCWAGINLDVSAYRQAEEALNEQKRILEILNRVGLSLTGELDVEKVIETVTEAGRDVSEAGGAAFYIHSSMPDGPSTSLHALCGGCRERAEHLLASGALTEVFAQRKLLRQHSEEFSFLAIPMVSRADEVLGALVLMDPLESGGFSTETERILLGLAPQAAIAIDNARLYERAQKSAEHLGLAMSAARLGDWHWDAETDLMTMSPRLSEIFCLKPGTQMTRSEMRQLLSPEDANRAREAMLEAVRNQGDYSIEYQIHFPNGEDRWISSIGRTIFGADGKVTGMLGVSQDITERKTTEATLKEAKETAEAANLAKDRFLAVLSHELRTPLTPALISVSDLESDPRIPTDIQDEISMIRRNIELETKLIDDLLDISRITSGKLSLRLEMVDLNEAVRQVCSICTPQVSEKAIRLEMKLQPDLGNVSADPARLQQILWNILKNAAKFTPENGVITVSTQRKENTLGIEVTDSGMGIPTELLPHIFDAFEQGDEKITRQFGGLGLGLAITRALVEFHGGTIRASSQGAGNGATFSIDLPAGETIPAPNTSRPIPQPKAEPHSQRLLLVEDHADTAKALSRLLMRSGFQVQTASNVASALILLSSEVFDVVVSDIGLPDQTGYDLMRQVREHHAVPGIAMSGFGMEEDIRRSRDAGFSEHLVKPITAARLEAAIRTVLG